MIEKICDAERCTGCSLCIAVCPKNAIRMEYNEEGFLIPRINDTCVECNLCRNACIANENADGKEDSDITKTYMAWNKNDSIRKESTSGGIFSLLAEQILRQGGVVCGAAFDENFKLSHISGTQMSDIMKMRGSKYIQSNLETILSDIKKHLEEGKTVLFSGTPCQVKAVKKYCGKTKKLLTCDMVCYGVGSTKFFWDFLRDSEKKYGAKANKILFRKKKYGYRNSVLCVEFENGKKYEKILHLSLFGKLFGSNLIHRESCFSCSYVREGDITLGDFPASVMENERIRDIKLGISLCIVNTEKGEELFERIASQICSEDVNYDKIQMMTAGLNRKGKSKEKRDVFMKEYKEDGYQRVAERYKKVSMKKKLYYRFYNTSCFLKKFKL